jgi:peptide/nickel transport system substrate-binding protein
MNAVSDMSEGPRPRPQFEDVADVVRYQLSRRSLVGGGAAAALTGLLAACSGNGGTYSDKPANDKPAATKTIQIGKANIPVPREIGRAHV